MHPISLNLGLTIKTDGFEGDVLSWKHGLVRRLIEKFLKLQKLAFVNFY